LTACGILLDPEVVLVLTEEVELGCLAPTAVGILLGVVDLAAEAFGLTDALAFVIIGVAVFFTSGLSGLT